VTVLSAKIGKKNQHYKRNEDEKKTQHEDMKRKEKKSS
jgi:hypothetical protein